MRIRNKTATLRWSASTHDTPFFVAACSIHWLARGRPSNVCDGIGESDDDVVVVIIVVVYVLFVE